MKDTVALILAAGEGTRMKSSLPKVLHPVGGRPMLSYVLGLVKALGIKRIIVVVGHKSERVKQYLGKNITTIKQDRLLGTADAVNRTKRLLSGFKGDVLVLYGDVPLIRKETLRELILKHRSNRSYCTLLSATVDSPSELGRIVRDDHGQIIKIIEEQEASPHHKTISEVNAGVYCFRSIDLFEALKEVKPSLHKKEFYLTDVIEILTTTGRKVDSISTDEPQEAIGINSKADLARAEKLLRERVLARFMSEGVTIIDPSSTYIDNEVKIGCDTIIYPNTVIERDVEIGKDCSIGPFCRIRSGVRLKDNVKVGNFVELNRTMIDKFSQVKHLSYLGDAKIGKKVNIGAGTITANYDGLTKNRTLIEDGASIGSGTVLVAPVKVGRRAVTGAGAVVTKGKDVPPGAVVVGVPAKILKKAKNYSKRG